MHIQHEAVEMFAAIGEAFAVAARIAISHQEDARIEEQKEAIESEKRRVQLMRTRRLALNVFKKTKNYKTIAEMLGSMGAARALIHDDGVLRRKMQKAARDEYIQRLHAQGHSLRSIARRYGLHHSSIERIVSR